MNHRLFAGTDYDQDTGLYYLRHRWYDPVAGLFIQRDPLPLGQASDPYGYAHNRSWTTNDWTGLQPLGGSNKGQNGRREPNGSKAQRPTRHCTIGHCATSPAEPSPTRPLTKQDHDGQKETIEQSHTASQRKTRPMEGMLVTQARVVRPAAQGLLFGGAWPTLKGGCVDADPVAMWAGICFVAVVTVVYFFLNNKTGGRE